jgi:hypothetical protein
MPEKSRVEVIDGALIVNPRPIRLHQRIVRNLTVALMPQLPPEWDIDQDIDVLLRDEPLDYVAPDVVVLSATAPFVKGPFPAEAVLLVVEVVSRGSRREDRAMKHLAYAEAGIRFYWRLESPVGGAVGVEMHTFRLRDGESSYDSGTVHRNHLTVTDPFPIDVDLNALMPGGSWPTL